MLSPLLVSQILTLEMETFQGGRSGAWEHKTQEGLDRWEIASPTGQIDVSLEKEEID